MRIMNLPLCMSVEKKDWPKVNEAIKQCKACQKNDKTFNQKSKNLKNVHFPENEMKNDLAV